MFQEKDPQCVHLAEQVSDQLSGLVFSSMVAIDQVTQSGIPRPPLAPGGRGMGHVTQALQFGQRPRATCGDFWVGALGQAASPSDEMRQTGLALRHPGLIDTVAIADQDTSQSSMRAKNASLERRGSMR